MCEVLGHEREVRAQVSPSAGRRGDADTGRVGRATGAVADDDGQDLGLGIEPKHALFDRNAEAQPAHDMVGGHGRNLQLLADRPGCLTGRRDGRGLRDQGRQRSDERRSNHGE